MGLPGMVLSAIAAVAARLCTGPSRIKVRVFVFHGGRDPHDCRSGCFVIRRLSLPRRDAKLVPASLYGSSSDRLEVTQVPFTKEQVTRFIQLSWHRSRCRSHRVKGLRSGRVEVDTPF